MPGALNRVISAGIAVNPPAGVAQGRSAASGSATSDRDRSSRTTASSRSRRRSSTARSGTSSPNGCASIAEGFNLFDAKVSDIDYFFESRLQGRAGTRRGPSLSRGDSALRPGGPAGVVLAAPGSIRPTNPLIAEASRFPCRISSARRARNRRRENWMVPSDFATVNYYRCEGCGHVWTTSKKDGSIVTHVTPLTKAPKKQAS